MKMKMKDNKSYLLVSMCRSIDNNHFGKGVHLLGSVFYTTNYDFSNLNPIEGQNYFIIRLTLENSQKIMASQSAHSKTAYEIILSVLQFINLYYKYDFMQLDKFLKSLVIKNKEIIPDFKELKNLENILNESLFVFEDMNWFTLQSLFKNFYIDLSGGTISKRFALSTAQYNLSRFLIELGYEKQDVFDSYTMLRKFSRKDSNTHIDLDVVVSLDKETMSSSLRKYYLNKISFLNKDIENLERNNKDKESNIISLENNISTRISDKLSKNKNIKNSKRILEHNKNIENLKKIIDKNNKEISLLKSQISDLSNEKQNLKNLSFDEIREKYYLYCHNDIVSQNSKIFKQGLLSIKNTKTKLKSVHSKNLTKRSYSTFSSLNNPYLNNSKSIASENLMKLLYSADSKENIQKIIENYLISQQNNTILNQITESNINYKVLNSKVNKVLLDSKLKLKNLYTNYISSTAPQATINKSKKKSNPSVEKKDILKIVGFEYVLNIMLGRLLRIMSDQSKQKRYYTDIAFDLGNDLINRYNYNLYLNYNSEFNSFSLFKKLHIDKILNNDDPTLKVELGTILLGFLFELKLLTFKVELFELNEKKRILYVGENLNKLISKEKFSVLNIPKKIPMIVSPKKYTGEKGKIQLGGYLLNDVNYTESLFIDNPNLVEKTKVSAKNIIYKMVDNINSVSFAINEEVLDFIIKNYKKYDLLLDPEYSHPYESKSKLTLSEKRELESFNSKRNLESNILNLALIFKNCSEFYLPVRLDYRGRLYCNVDYLTYQGIDLAKSLLKFSKGELVKLSDNLSINYLKIFGANCFGQKLDKKSFAERVKWVENNEKDIINFENGILISKAENKLLFIAFCFEYKKYIEALNNKETYFKTHLPIQLDATCNGFQHLSLLLEDSTLAYQVNLNSSTWENIPNDFYSFLTLRCKEYFKSELLNNKQLDKTTKDSYERLCNVDYQSHRQLVKKTIMTIPYSSTKYANKIDMKVDFKIIKQKNEKLYVYNKDNNIVFKDVDFTNICNTLYICLYRDFPKLKALLEYFKDIAKVSNKLGISIPWNLPTGLEVSQRYYGTKTIKLKPFIYTKDVLNLNVIDKNIFNTRKQFRALMPNLVHSLDAASLALLIDIFFKKNQTNNFYSIHDCFAVTCNNVSLMVQLLKLSYYEIYCTNSFLRKFDNNFKKTILLQLGKNCFAKDNSIVITNTEGGTIKIKYPNVEQVIKPTKIDFMNGSYILN